MAVRQEVLTERAKAGKAGRSKAQRPTKFSGDVLGIGSTASVAEKKELISAPESGNQDFADACDQGNESTMAQQVLLDGDRRLDRIGYSTLEISILIHYSGESHLTRQGLSGFPDNTLKKYT